jgi:SAM-dependent methyltransferase
MNDKGDILANLPRVVRLDLGCGPRKRDSSRIGIDLLDLPTVDIVGDALDVLRRFPNRSVDEIFSSHFLEHASELPDLIKEMGRIVKPGGTLQFFVPHFSNPYYYSDPTHRTPFGLYSFCYFSQCRFLRRKVPHYWAKVDFELISVHLHFKSPPPFFIRFALKRTFGLLANLGNWSREFYEEWLCYLVPCYELEFRLVRLSDAQ